MRGRLPEFGKGETWAAILALSSAVCIPVTALFNGHDLASTCYRFWPVVIAGIAASALGLVRYRNRLFLLPLVLIIGYVLPLIGLLAACATGNCL